MMESLFSPSQYHHHWVLVVMRIHLKTLSYLDIVEILLFSYLDKIEDVLETKEKLRTPSRTFSSLVQHTNLQLCACKPFRGVANDLSHSWNSNIIVFQLCDPSSCHPLEGKTT
jgi:hypothetical protein